MNDFSPFHSKQFEKLLIIGIFHGEHTRSLVMKNNLQLFNHHRDYPVRCRAEEGSVSKICSDFYAFYLSWQRTAGWNAHRQRESISNYRVRIRKCGWG